MDFLPNRVSDYKIGRSLRLFNPRIRDSSGGFVADVSQAARGYRRSIRRNGGYWRGSFSLVDETPGGAQAMQLADFFFNRLGYHFEERSGGAKTWEGMIYEMDLSIGNLSYRASLDLLYNGVLTKYNDENDESQTSAWAFNAASISRYGRREEYLLLDSYPQASAEAQRDTYLKEYAWPWPRMAGFNNRPRQFPTLTVTLCGYIATANWRFTTISDGLTEATLDDVSTVIETVVTDDCEFLQKGAIEANPLQVNKYLNIPQRAWDLIQFFLELGDAENDIYRAYVDNDRRFYYRAIDPADVQHFLRGGKVYNSAGGVQEANYWQLKPGVYRAMDYPGNRSDYTPWFSDARDFFVEEVEYGDGYDAPILKTAYFDETSILAAQAAYERELEREREAAERRGK